MHLRGVPSQRDRVFLRRDVLFMLAILSVALIAAVVTVVVPRVRMSALSDSLLEKLDPEYLAYHAMLKDDAADDDNNNNPVSSGGGGGQSPSRRHQVLRTSQEKEKRKKKKSSSKNKKNADDDEMPRIRIFRRDSSSSGHGHFADEKNSNSKKKKNVFRIAVFTDLHFGEDGHLDILSMQFQQKVLRSQQQSSSSNSGKIHLAVMLGDEVSQLDYANLRRPIPRSASSSSAAAAKHSIPSCLRDSVLGAKSCFRQAHEAVLREGVPFVTVLGNHQSPDPSVLPSSDLSSSPTASQCSVSLAEMLRDLGEHVKNKQKQAKMAMLNSNNKNEDEHHNHVEAPPKKIGRPLCPLEVDSACTVVVPRGNGVGSDDALDDEEQQQEQQLHLDLDASEEDLKHKFLSVEPQILLSFFNSVADETDTLLLHGYKYPSGRQLRQFRTARKRLDWIRQQQKIHQRSSSKNTKQQSIPAPPIHIAFVHIPPPLFLDRASVLAAAGSLNETPGCAPRGLDGPRDFSAMLVGGESMPVNIVISGHDHKNDEWSVRDRSRLVDSFSGSSSSSSSSSSNKQDLPSMPLHVAYGRHSGFGGYFDVSHNSRMPGARIVEIFELAEEDVKILDEQQPQQRRPPSCEVIALHFADLKLCHHHVAGGYFVLVRSWILEAVVKHAAFPESEAVNRAELSDERSAKAAEPAERLMHAQLKHFNVVGLVVDEQVLMSPPSPIAAGVSFGECSDQVDYRTQFSVLVFLLWTGPVVAIAVAVRRVMQDEKRRLVEKVV